MRRRQDSALEKRQGRKEPLEPTRQVCSPSTLHLRHVLLSMHEYAEGVQGGAKNCRVGSLQSYHTQ